ncbi:MAG: hypothetical protein RIS47_1950 [Bacteroidota bacterium]|jgi:hypothetical protein
MKKIVLLIAIVFAIAASSQAQIEYGVKFGLNYNFSGVDKVEVPTSITDITKGTGDRAGLHFGGFVRFKVPLLGLYLQPELLYTRLNTSYVQKAANGTNEDFKIGVNRIDIPVLFGRKMLGFTHIHAGPVFSFNTNEMISLANTHDASTTKMNLGLHVGVGLDLGHLIIDARYETALNKTVTEFLLGQAIGGTDQQIQIDNRPSMILISAAYKF